MHITIIGKGAYGRAVGSLLEYNRQPFAYVDIDLPMQQTADLVILTVPTQFLRQALTDNRSWFAPRTIIINCAKGIEKETHAQPYQIVAETVKPTAYYSLMGPSFAEEIVERVPTIVSLGYAQETHVQEIKQLLQTPYFRLQETPDFQALELSAALKNVYAILCGFADGLNYRMNTRAKLITLALQEFATLAQAMNIPFHGLAQPGLVGDLVLTCSSTESRNFTFGRHLSTMTPTDALQASGPTVEGYHTSFSIQALAQQYSVELPLATLTHTIINQGQAATEQFHRCLASY